MDPLPGVVLLGTDSPVSLGIIRELGRHGVLIHGIGARDSIGRASRYLASFSVRAKGVDLLAQLRRVSREKSASYIMTVSEPDIAFLQRYADELLPARPLVPASDAFGKVVAKDKAIEAARAVGIRVPRTFQPESPEFSRIADADEWEFPVVLKWADPNMVRDVLEQHDLPLDKAVYCFSAAQVERYLQQFAAVDCYPLVQEYCRGVGLGHFIFMYQGEPIQTFQHLRLREWPPEGGTSTACRALEFETDDALMQSSIDLLRSLSWEGVAMVEYRFDKISGDAVFMEVNGRFWGSFPLAVASGADFAWLQYSVMGLGRVPEISKPTYSRTCRFMVPEVKRLARVLFFPRAITDPMFVRRPFRELRRFIVDFFSPSACYYVFRWDDPVPFLKDIANLVIRVVRL